MKKTAIKLLSLVLLLCSLGVFAETIYVSDGYSYTHLDDTYISICGWDNGSDAFVVPTMLEGFPVQEVANIALRENDYITSINLNDAAYLTRIGDMAFKDCVNLAGSVSLPSRLTSIGWGVFQGCISITEVNYYSDITYVPVQCFYGCSSLEKVLISDGVQEIRKYAFSYCGALNYVRIPQSVTSIHSTAFNNCPNLVIYCYTGSYAQQYAEDKGIDYVLIDAPEPTEPPTEEPTAAPTAAPTEAPTLAPTEAPTESGEYILGDADGNGTVDIVDATYIQRVIAELPVPFPMETLMHGDVDGDGELTIADATLIQRYIAEMPVFYSIGEPVTKAPI